MKHLKIGYLQQHNVADVKTNMQRLADGVRDLAKRGAELVVLQELHNSLYFCQVEDVDNFDLAEPIPGPSTDFYGALARECNVVIVTSLFERRAPGLYHNTAVVMERDGSIAGKYRKMHIPDDPAYYEKFYFTPGDLGFRPIQTSVGKLGVLVCWDQWYPEAARLMALQGAELLIYPTAIGYAASDTEDEQQRQREGDDLVERLLGVVAVERTRDVRHQHGIEDAAGDEREDHLRNHRAGLVGIGCHTGGAYGGRQQNRANLAGDAARGRARGHDERIASYGRAHSSGSFLRWNWRHRPTMPSSTAMMMNTMPLLSLICSDEVIVVVWMPLSGTPS